ncbi:MAG: glycosyltransferase family 2 protein [Aristaeellaceae bacterium]
MKTISVMIPCYNEEENVRAITEAVRSEIQTELPAYDYEIVIIDNKSRDNTRAIIRQLCAEDPHVRAIFNMKNFGQFNSPYYGLTQCTGDCVISICADFQDPVELIPDMVHQWEQGHKVICMVKTRSEESRLMYWARECYYRLIKKMSDVEQIRQFTGFGLYDRQFIQVLRDLKDPMPFIRGIVAEYAPDHLEIPYTQPQRRAGKTHNNFYTLYDAAMLSFTSYTKAGLRIITFGGFVIAGLSFLVALIYLVLKLVNWYGFNAGMAPIVIGVFLMGGLQLAALGFIGEYILTINQRVMHKPLVIEEERLNFPGGESDSPHAPQRRIS